MRARGLGAARGGRDGLPPCVVQALLSCLTQQESKPVLWLPGLLICIRGCCLLGRASCPHQLSRPPSRRKEHFNLGSQTPRGETQQLLGPPQAEGPGPLQAPAFCPLDPSRPDPTEPKAQSALPKAEGAPGDRKSHRACSTHKVTWPHHSTAGKGLGKQRSPNRSKNQGKALAFPAPSKTYSVFNQYFFLSSA